MRATDRFGGRDRGATAPGMCAGCRKKGKVAVIREHMLDCQDYLALNFDAQLGPAEALAAALASGDHEDGTVFGEMSQDDDSEPVEGEIDGEVVQPTALSPQDRMLKAKARLNRICNALGEGFSQLRTALHERDWDVLGYPDPAAYVQAVREGVPYRWSLETGDRQELVWELRLAGHTIREIEAATGSGHGTVIRDVAAAQEAAGGPNGPPEAGGAQ